MPKKSKNLSSVTVIIPCYNSEKFLKKTIESALSQTNKENKIIAVDDGSKDSTRQILDSYAGRITILEHPGKVNRGQSASINLAMRSSESDYIAILHSDDLWDKKNIERKASFLDDWPDVGMVYSDGYAIDENGSKIYKLFPSGHKETNQPERILLDCYIRCPSGCVMRRSVMDKAGGFDEELRDSEDHDLILRLAEITKFAFLPEDLWYYRRHVESLSRRRERRMWEVGFRILEKACRRYEYSLSVRRKRIALLNYRLGRCLAAENGFLKAAPYFLKAGLLDPLRTARVLLGLEKKN